MKGGGAAGREVVGLAAGLPAGEGEAAENRLPDTTGHAQRTRREAHAHAGHERRSTSSTGDSPTVAVTLGVDIFGAVRAYRARRGRRS